MGFTKVPGTDFCTGMEITRSELSLSRVYAGTIDNGERSLLTSIAIPEMQQVWVYQVVDPHIYWIHKIRSKSLKIRLMFLVSLLNALITLHSL